MKTFGFLRAKIRGILTRRSKGFAAHGVTANQGQLAFISDGHRRGNPNEFGRSTEGSVPNCTGDTRPSDGLIHQHCQLFTNAGRSAALANVRVEGRMTVIWLRPPHGEHLMPKQGFGALGERQRDLPIGRASGIATETS